jgi:hypothetical protein
VPKAINAGQRDPLTRAFECSASRNVGAFTRFGSKHQLAGQVPVSCHRFRGRDHAICPSAPAVPSAVSYAANDRISTSASAGGCTRLIRPRRSALAAAKCARSEMVWFWPYPLSGGPGWPYSRLARHERAQRCLFRKFESKGSLFGQGQIEQSLVACPIRAQYAVQLHQLPCARPR